MDALKQIFGAGWVGSLISFAGLIAALILYRASRIGGRPVYQVRVLRLLSRMQQELPIEIEVFYKGSSVTRLTRVQIAFWNSGNSIIRGADIVADDPLRFVFDADGVALTSVVEKSTRCTNKFQVKISADRPNEVLCAFDYLDPGDGAKIDVLHTGSRGSPECLGTIRGIPAGMRDWGRLGGLSPPLDYMIRRMYRFFNIFMSLMGLFLVTLAYFVEGLPGRALLLIFGSIYLIGSLLDWRQRRRPPRDLRLDET